MKAKSIKGKSIGEIKSALAEAMGDGFKPTLAIAFVSIKLDRDRVREIFNGSDIALFGATTNGEFIDEVTETGSAAILLLDVDRRFFQVDFDEYPIGNYRKVATGIAERAKERFSTPAFLIALSHQATDGEEILHGFEDVIGPQVTVFGGCAGDDYSFSDQVVFTNAGESKKGMVAVAFDETKVNVKGVATCGWKAIGTEKTVTKSEGNHVYTVDNIPVLDITAKYGGIANVTPDNNNLLLEIAANLPLQLQREKGDPIMRPGLKIDWSDHSFYTSGPVPQGSKVKFSVQPDLDVMETAVRSVEKLKATEMAEADAVVVFSCAGRILSFGPMMNLEIEGLKKVWNAPMAGMFSNAELGRATGGNLEMHNLTTCVVALKEI